MLNWCAYYHACRFLQAKKGLGSDDEEDEKSEKPDLPPVKESSSGEESDSDEVWCTVSGLCTDCLCIYLHTIHTHTITLNYLTRKDKSILRWINVIYQIK